MISKMAKLNKRIKVGFFWLVATMMMVSCSTDRNLSRALSDIKNRNVNRNTIDMLERAKTTAGCEAESCYNLARIYHFNPQLNDLDKARLYYQQTLSFYQMSSMQNQMTSLSKKYGINYGSIQKAVNDVDQLICSKAFSDCVRENTFAGYVKFVKKYPTSSQAVAAKDKALVLKKSVNTIAGYSEYLEAFPDYKKTDVIALAATKAKSMNTNSSYVEFLSLFAEAIDNVGDLNLPIFKQASEYLAIYNRSLKYKSDEVKAKFTNQFVSEQQNLCKGNEKRLRELCKLTPFPFSLTKSNLKSIKELMYSVKVNDNLVFYTETGKGYILDRFNDFYDCDIQDGLPHGHGTVAFADGTRYDGDFTKGDFTGIRHFRYPSGATAWYFPQRDNTENYEYKVVDPKNKRHTYEYSGKYDADGKKDGVWRSVEKFEEFGLGWLGLGDLLPQKFKSDVTKYHYSHGELIRVEVVSDDLTKYIKSAPEREARAAQEERDRIIRKETEERARNNYNTKSIGKNDYIGSDIILVTFADETRGYIIYSSQHNCWYYTYSLPSAGSLLWSGSRESRSEAINALFDLLH